MLENNGELLLKVYQITFRTMYNVQKNQLAKRKIRRTTQSFESRAQWMTQFFPKVGASSANL